MKISRKSGFCLTAAICSLALSSPLAAQQAPARAAIGTWGVELENMSSTIRPGDDFYRYVNEGWLKTTDIPKGMAEMNDAVSLYLANEKRVSDIIGSALATKHPSGSPEQQVADYYRSVADMATRNALGLKPIATGLAMIAGTKDHGEISRATGFTWTSGIFGAGNLANANNPNEQIAAIAAAGYTLPSRDYYIDPGETNEKARAALLDYAVGTFRRAGFADAEARGAKVVALEGEIAKRHWTSVEMRDVNRTNRIMTPAELKAWAPGFDWDAYFLEMGYQGQPKIKVIGDTAVRDIAKLYGSTSVEDLQSLMLFQTLDRWAPFLSEEWVNAHFDFHARALKGINDRRPRELENVALVDDKFGEEIGRIYVSKYFPESYRAEVNSMIGYLRDAYKDRISKLDWMDAPTKAEAMKKLEKVVSHIGYPEKWHDRSSVRIDPTDLLGNEKRLLDWQRADGLKELAEGTRKWEFPYKPHEINAGYIASYNSITFPAGFLQPPYFDPAADPAVNFGSMVAVIGHEFGHGFDDQGSRSDGDGVLRDWWTPASRAEFEKRTAGLVDQFNAYEPVPGAKINGRQNLGENIGDLGGLSVAYEAYRNFVRDKQGGKAPVLSGFTGDQRFFLSWAQVWRGLMTESETRRRLLTDNHSPNEFRVNGVVRNVDAWYKAFNVKPNDKLYLPPEQRVRIW